MSSRPKITISSLDAERLESLLEAMSKSSFPGKAQLETELLRADILEPREMPSNVVTMNSTVRFKVLTSGEDFTYTLVYPKDMDANSNKISVLAPVGSALLGLSQGEEIEWPAPGGGVLKVRIEEVVFQPERAGELHR
jgi:regulator of nucleoside diphosphate kinase